MSGVESITERNPESEQKDDNQEGISQARPREYWNFSRSETLRTAYNDQAPDNITRSANSPETIPHGHGLQSVTSGRSIIALPPQSQQTGTLLRHLSIRPGQDGFMLWYSVSNSFPIIAASLGPISNLNSVAALADPWRMSTVDKNRPGDYKWILALNAISLFIGCTANLSLFLNFSGRINYIYAQMASIVGWYVAFGLLFTILIASRFVYFGAGSPYIRSEGYWHAIFTAVLYFISATMLLVNWIGHSKGMYSASFNLTATQRRIMLQNVLLIIWIGLGGLLFSQLIHIRYTDAVYYCVVTVTTIGLGDIVPNTVVSRWLVLPYALIGVIYLGLIVTTITSVVLHSNGEAMVFDQSERARTKVYEHMLKRAQTEDPIPAKESFLLIHKMHRAAKRRRKLSALYASLFAFSTFWLVGAMIFQFTEESWSYFDGLYFVSLCLLTIGYGDYVPKSSAGRAFFIIWALGAVPMMTILISNLSDNVFQWIIDIGDAATAWLLAAYSIRQQYYVFWKNRFRRLAVFMSRRAKQDIKGEDQEVVAEEVEEEQVDEQEEQEEEQEEEQMEEKESNGDDDENSGSTEGGIKPFTSNTSENDHRGNYGREEVRIGGNTKARDSESNQTAAEEPEEASGGESSKSVEGSSPHERRNMKEITRTANRLLEIVKEVRVLAQTAVKDPMRRFDYDDWRRISHLLTGGDLDNIRPDFWLSENSPIRFPVPEVRYFLHECLESLEVGVGNMVDLLNEEDTAGSRN